MANNGSASPSMRHRTRRFSAWTTLVWIAGGLVYLFLLLPVLVIVLSAFSPKEYPEFPPTGFSLRWFSAITGNSDWSGALWNSTVLLVIVTLLYVFTGMGLIGTMTGLIIGHVIVAFPYVVRTVGVSVSNLNPKLELASMSLGAGPVKTFFRVTLPLIKPGIVAGGVFSAVTSFGEVSISLFVYSPSTVTVPVRIFNYIEQTYDPAVNAVSVIFIAVAVIALIIIERTIGLTKVM